MTVISNISKVRVISMGERQTKVMDELLGQPLDKFGVTVTRLSESFCRRLLLREHSCSARQSMVQVLERRIARLQGRAYIAPSRPQPVPRSRGRIEEAMALALCHIQTGSIDKRLVVKALKAGLSELA